jgi:hypothetical protein
MGAIYPSWYPDCQDLAADVGKTHVTEKIDATTGHHLSDTLANDSVWAGFPSVNQVHCNLVAFAGQFKGESNYYNQDINYIWVTNTSTNPPKVAPLDQEAPTGAGFEQQFQGCAGWWWFPDGNWFAFESNPVCDQIDGFTYVIFIQDVNGARSAIQVTDCSWNTQHPKWFPPRKDGTTPLIVAAQPGPCCCGCDTTFEIATLDVAHCRRGTLITSVVVRLLQFRRCSGSRSRVRNATAFFEIVCSGGEWVVPW